MVLPDNSHLAVSLTQGATVDEKPEFGRKRRNDSNNRGKMKAVNTDFSPTAAQVAYRECDNENRHVYHDEAEEDVTGRLQARPACLKPPRIDMVCGTIGENKDEVAERVEYGVRHGRYERQRTRSNRGEDLQRRQDEVGDKRSIHGDLEMQRLRPSLSQRISSVFFYTLEHPLDRLVLPLIEAAQPPCFEGRKAERHARSRSVGATL